MTALKAEEEEKELIEKRQRRRNIIKLIGLGICGILLIIIVVVFLQAFNKF